MLKYIKGQDYIEFDHGLFVALVHAQFPEAVINSEGNSPVLGTPGFVTVDLPESDHGAVLEILTVVLPGGIALRDLNMTKAAKLAAIQAEKIRALDAGVMVEGVLFDIDASARVAYLELAMRLAANPALSTNWKASLGQWVTMDAALFDKLNVAGEAHIRACFAWQSAREAEVAAAFAAGDMAGIEAVSTVYSGA